MRKMMLVALGSLALAGCAAEGTVTRLSTRFGICARLPQSTTYRHVRDGIDYSVGLIETPSRNVEVYFGFAPNFPMGHWNGRRLGASGEYVLVGEATHQGKERLLFANWRYPERGPVLVMLSASHFGSAKSEYTDPSFFSDCGPSEW